METLGFIVIGLLGLSLVVTIHEAGHFVAARWAGVEVEAFAVGWGKVLWSWKPGATEYRLCLLPLGGYCKMKGEQDLRAALEAPEAPFTPAAGSLFAARPWKRVVISAAGPLFNLIFSLLLFGTLQVVGTPETGPPAQIVLGRDLDGRSGLPAETAGLATGDTVRSIGGTVLRSFSDLQRAVAASGSQTQTWVVDRGGVELRLAVTPRYDATERRTLVGVSPFVEPVVKTVRPGSASALAGFLAGDRVVAVDTKALSHTAAFAAAVKKAGTRSVTVTVERGGTTVDLLLVPEGGAAGASLGLDFVLPTFPAQPRGLVEGAVAGWNQTWGLLGQLVSGLVQLVTGQTGPGEGLSGPLRITYTVGEAAASGFGEGWGQGWAAAGGFLAFVSLALFLMNLLPIPALDGGAIVVSLIEAALRRPLKIQTWMRYQQVGIVLILGLILFSTFNDLSFLFGPK